MEYVGKIVCKTIAENFNSIQDLKENEDIMKNKIEELSCRESDVLEELQRANVQFGKKPKKEVELWLERVQKIKDEVCDIEQKLREERRHLSLSSLNLAKLVGKNINKVVELLNKRFEAGLFADSFQASGMTLPTTELVGEKTAKRNLKMIEEWIMDDEVGKIGVFGMGGVGKTTVMTHIHNKLKDTQIFSSVIWVTVSRDSYLEKLQTGVAKALHVHLSGNEDAMIRSANLFGAFIRRGKFLLILDDMWKAFSLKEVGIPEPNEENKCKVVWTTQFRNVRRGMGSQKTIKVDCKNVMVYRLQSSQ